MDLFSEIKKKETPREKTIQILLCLNIMDEESEIVLPIQLSLN